MKLRKVLAGAALSVALSVAPVALGQAARTADQITADYKALKAPAFDRTKSGDSAYIQEYQSKMQEFQAKQAELAKELWAADPNHPDALKMMQNRWRTLAQTGKLDEAKPEIDAAIASAPAEKKVDLEFFAAQLAMMSRNLSAEDRLAKADAFIKAHPGDARGGDLLSMAASSMDEEKAIGLYRRIASDFPTARSAAQAKGKIRQLEGVGKPFEMSFTDAITGKPVSNDTLKGKVVVVDFWATWCGPCVAEMPHMKEIYAKYKGKGVEFVGVSLDAPESEGGLEKLKKFVKDNDIQWPQYYQGNGWQSQFSSSWGINAIPALFVVDQKGNLYSINARGQVEQIIEKLLGDQKAAPVGG